MVGTRFGAGEGGGPGAKAMLATGPVVVMAATEVVLSPTVVALEAAMLAFAAAP